MLSNYKIFCDCSSAKILGALKVQVVAQGPKEHPIEGEESVEGLGDGRKASFQSRYHHVYPLGRSSRLLLTTLLAVAIPPI